MAGDPDPYVQTLDAIELRRTSLSVGAPASSQEGGWSADEVAAALAELDADEALLRAHWRASARMVGAQEPPTCAECGDTQYCSTARDLFQKYNR